MEKIISNQNPRIKEIIKLRKAGKRKKNDMFVIEGQKEILLAKKSGIEISALLFCPNYCKTGLPNEFAGLKAFEVDNVLFKKVSLRESPDGFLALAVPRFLCLEDVVLKKDSLILILESIEKPGNLGAILRSADASAVDYVILSDAKTDIYNPNAIRSSLGTVFTNKIIFSQKNILISWLKQNMVKIFAATPDTDKIYTDQNLCGLAAIVIGTEHDGLSKEWLDDSVCKIKIPMRGKIDSLNASVSAAIILFEARRQRGF